MKNNIKHIERPQIVAFWNPEAQHGYLGQWFPSQFEFTQDICDNFPNQIKELNLYKHRFDVILALMNHTYQTAEKFMMMGKAALFEDNEIFNLIDETNTPKRQRELGRKVRGFDDVTWFLYCCDIVKIGTYLKFSQNPDLQEKLEGTGNALLVEGSPVDKIWGVGLKYNNPDIQFVERWKGTNYLGECLMFVRHILLA